MISTGVAVIIGVSVVAFLFVVVILISRYMISSEDNVKIDANAAIDDANDLLIKHKERKQKRKKKLTHKNKTQEPEPSSIVIQDDVENQPIIPQDVVPSERHSEKSVPLVNQTNFATEEEEDVMVPQTIVPKFEENIGHEALTDDDHKSVHSHHSAALDSADSYVNTFRRVLSSAVTMTRFSKGKSRVVKCQLNGNEFYFETAGNWTRKKKSVAISSIQAVLKGKQSAEFSLSAAGRNAKEENCFSLLTKDIGSIDFEASSRIDRDAFVEGFELLCDCDAS